MEAGLKELKEFISNQIHSFVTFEQARKSYYYLKGASALYSWLETSEYSRCLALLAYFGIQGGLVDDALDFINKEYPQYKEEVRFDYFNKSLFLYQWAALLEEKGLTHESLEKVKKATLFNFVDNVTYDNYEFLSFRGCTKYVLSEIADETLSLMHPSEFNDPMDTVMLQWLDNQIANGVPGFVKQKEALKNLRVRCFSRTAKLPRNESADDYMKLRRRQKQNVCRVSPLMWAHYADNHKGICIKYKFNSRLFPLLNKEETELFRIGNIDYKSKFSVNEFEIRIWDALFSKSKVWEYEHETRLVYYSINNIPKVKTVDVPGAITGIYLGLRCSCEDERIIKSLVKDRNIPIYRMYTDINDVYKLKAKLIV